MTLFFVLAADGGFEGFFFLGAPCPAFEFDAIAPHGCQHARGLFAAHHADTGVRPHPQKARRKGASAHSVIARAKTAADDDGELRHVRSRHRRDHFCAVAGNALVFVFAPDHKARDILQKHQRDFALAAEFDEVCALQRRFAEQNAVVGDDADGHSFDVRKAAHQRRAEAGFEFVQLTAIDNAGDDFAHIKRLARIGWNDSIQLFCCIFRSIRCTYSILYRLFMVQMRNRLAG